MPGEQFAGGLFDSDGPNQFKQAVSAIGTAFTEVGKSVDTLSGKLDNLSGKLGGILSQLQSINAAGGSSLLSATGGLGSGSSSNNGGVNNGGFSSQVPRLGSTFGGSNGGSSNGSGTGLSFGNIGFSGSRLAVGAAVAGTAAIGRATASQVQPGLTLRQLEFGIQTNTGMSLQQAGGYATNFIGYNGNYGDLSSAMQTLNGVGGYGQGRGAAGATFNSRMLQAGFLQQAGLASGFNMNLTQAAQVGANLGGVQGLMVMRNLGINPNQIGGMQNVNALSIAQLYSARIAAESNPSLRGFGGMLNASTVSSNTGQGSVLFRSLTNSVGAGGAGLDSNTAGALLQILAREQRAGPQGVTDVNTLANSGSTATQTRKALQDLGFSGSDLVKMENAQERLSRGSRSVQEGSADATTTMTQATDDFKAAVGQFSNAVGGLLGKSIGAAGVFGGAAGSAVGLVGNGLSSLMMARMLGGVIGGGGGGAGGLGSMVGRIPGIGGFLAGTASADGAAAVRSGGLFGAGGLADNLFSKGIGAGGMTGLASGLGGMAGIAAGSSLLSAGLRHRDNLAGGAMTVGGAALTGAGIGMFLGPEGALVGAGGGALVGSGIEAARHLFGWFGGGYNPSVANSSATSAPASPVGGGGSRVVSDAMKYLGVPYKWGGSNPKIGLDCSGLTQLVYKDIGISLPHYAADQAHMGTAVPNLAAAQPGDLVFYGGNGYDGTPAAPGHVGIYVGGGKMIDAPYTGQKVRYDSVGNPVAIRRIIGGNGSSGATSAVGGTSNSVAGTTSPLIASVNSVAGMEGTQMSESDFLSASLAPGFGGAIGGTQGNTVGNAGSAGSGGSSSKTATAAAVGAIPTGQHLALIQKSLQLAGIANNATNQAAVNTIVTHESSWNPNAVNNWDSNAKAGHPSQGLMQTIMGTFMEYALPGYNKNILDPLSNLIAGERYAVHNYGSLSAVAQREDRGEGYAKGATYIEKDQVTTVHKGEMVISAAQAAALRMNQMSSDGSSAGMTVQMAKGSVVLNLTSTTSGTPTTGSTMPTNRDLDALAVALMDRIEAEASRRRLVTS